MNSTTLIVIGIFFLTNTIYCHGDLHTRIKEVTVEIKNHPDSAYLYLKRGELWLQHDRYNKSIKDFKSCLKLGYNPIRLELKLAESYERKTKWKKSLAHLNNILTKDEKNVKAWRQKGSVFMKVGKYADAGFCFEKLIQLAGKTIPENYIDASVAWEKSNTLEHRQKSIQAIEKGIVDLGELIVFFKRLKNLYLKYEDYKMSLFYQTKIIEKSNRKERAYYDRALIHIAFKNKTKAKLDLDNSYQALNLLPKRIKNNQAMVELESLIMKNLAML